MRKSRLKTPDHHHLAYHQCASGFVDRQCVVGSEEKEEVVRLLHLYQEFCEVRVVTYCVMSNHFHVVMEVPMRLPQLPDDAYLPAKLKLAYNPEAFAQIRWQLENLRKLGAYVGRMYAMVQRRLRHFVRTTLITPVQQESSR